MSVILCRCVGIGSKGMKDTVEVIIRVHGESSKEMGGYDSNVFPFPQFLKAQDDMWMILDPGASLYQHLPDKKEQTSSQ